LPSVHWYRRIRQLKPDLVHLADATSLFIFLGLYTRRVLHLPTIASYLAPNLQKNPISQLGAHLTQFLLPGVYNGCTTLTHTQKRHLHNKWPTLALKVITPIVPTFPNASTQKFFQPGFFHHCLFVGSLDSHHYYKGVPYLIQSLTRVNKPCHLIIVGSGDKLSYYQSLKENTPSRHQITFLHDASPTVAAKLYQDAHLVLLPSTSSSEGFGIVLLEALSFGTPVITTSVTGMSYYLKQKPFADIIPPRSSNAIASAINQHVHQKYPSARQFARLFNAKQMSDHLIHFYQQIIT
jgi:glycosyltransferase involved in cell wall biosynthesis